MSESFMTENWQPDPGSEQKFVQRAQFAGCAGRLAGAGTLQLARCGVG
jgi:hypothetical protein